MKKIEAIIRPEKLEEVRKALDVAGYPGISITQIEGHGKQKGVIQQWRGEIYKVDLLSKTKIEIVISDKDVEKIISAIQKVAGTGNVGDGKIFISTVDEAIRIRTGERGDKAL
ncbi:MAG: transcriptional regulator [Candidatus Omnitrophica bacterium CG1_02_49_16]|nr:MAG: transcriptional regulator [Candidatus Omnitrophica bacterium CG1_02_49_16]